MTRGNFATGVTKASSLRRGGLLLGLLMTILALTSCAGNDGSASPQNPDQQGDRKLVILRVAMTGGMCSDGPCGSHLEVRRDGSWSATDNRDGQLESRELTHLIELIDAEAAGLAAIPETKTMCPSAVDGTDVTYTFRSTEGTVSVFNCRMNPPTSSPLLSLVTKIVGGIGSKG